MLPKSVSEISFERRGLRISRKKVDEHGALAAVEQDVET